MGRSVAGREAWLLIAELFHSSRREWSAAIGGLGLAPMQAFALRHLEPDTPLAMSALADALRCDNSNVTGIADRLEAAGLVERRAHATDRRIRALVLTQRGREVREQVIERMSEPPEAIARLSAADARRLRDLLRRAMGR